MDRRHQRDGRKAQGTGEHIYAKWEFFKMNLMTEKIEEIKEGRALLEICTAQVIDSVRSSDARRKYFGFSYDSRAEGRDVDYFNALDELKRGAKIYTKNFIYWAAHTPARQNTCCDQLTDSQFSDYANYVAEVMEVA